MFSPGGSDSVMVVMRNLGWGIVLCGICAASYAQQLVPLADPVENQLLPAEVSNLSMQVNGQLAYMFKDDDGTDAVHVIGESLLKLGEGEGQVLRGQEAVAWVTNRQHGDRPYRHLQILLWRDAEVREVGGTVTSGPALFVTLNTFGEIEVNADDVAFQTSADRRAYREGNTIRRAISEGTFSGLTGDVSLRVLDASGVAEKGKAPTPRPLIQVRSEGELAVTPLEEGRQVLTVTGGVYLSRGVPASADFLEIRADSVVVFLPPSSGSKEPAAPENTGLGGVAEQRQVRTPKRVREASDRQLMATGFGDVEVEAAYLEGDVVMGQGPNTIRASRLYYDFLEERAVILDAVVHTTIAQRNIPLYMRAAEIRQLDRNRFTATDAVLTTSEFHTPHYHVGARRVELVDLTPADPANRQSGIRAGSFRIRDATFNLGGHPLAYWPYLRGNIDTSETANKSIRMGYSGDFGAELETKWHLFNLLGLETPKGVDATLDLDYYSRRGPAIGVDAVYTREKYYGLLRGYLLTDSDQDFLGREREIISEKGTRGRFLLRHRQYLEDDWQVSLEMSYISDRSFLEEYFRSDNDNEKEQETLLHFKKQTDNVAFTATAQPRILDFTTQTERFPDLALHVVGEPLHGGGTWYSENRLGYVRLRGADQTFRELLLNGRAVSSGSVGRADSRQELDLPLDVGAVRVVPFGSVRGTAWDDSLKEGGVARAFGTYGLRSSAYLWRNYPDVHSTLLDIDGLRHVIKPDLTAWVSHTNVDSHKLFPFDELVERIDEVDGAVFGVRHRWQTKRGPKDAQRIVDVLTVETETGVFNDSPGKAKTNGYTSFSRPENSIARNFTNSQVVWRVNDRTALLSEWNYDLNDQQVDVLNVSMAVERSPRFSYLVGYRFIDKSKSDLLGVDMNYRLTEKHTLAIRELFDLQRGRTLDLTLAVIRKFPRWYGALSFALDEAEDDFGVSVSVWPEGLPEAALGSRRFTGLGTTTRISGE